MNNKANKEESALVADINEIPLEPAARIDAEKLMSAFDEYFYEATELKHESSLDKFNALDDCEQALVICVANALLDKPNLYLTDADKNQFHPRRMISGRMIPTRNGFMPYLSFIDSAIRRGREISSMQTQSKGESK